MENIKKRRLESAERPKEKKRRLSLIQPSDIRLGPLIGEGAFGQAFMCQVQDEDGNWNKGVLKKLKSKDKMRRRNFKKEIQRLQEVQEINGVPRLFGVMETPQESALAMSFNGHYTLKDYTRKYAEDWTKIFSVFSEVARILEDIHKLGLGHNDLHSGNVIIDEEEKESPSVTIIDYGFCSPFGSVLYAKPLKKFYDFHYDPQISRDGKTTSAESDIYSFGRLLARVPGSYGFMELKRMIKLALSPIVAKRSTLADFRAELSRLKKEAREEQDLTDMVDELLEAFQQTTSTN
ncbi:uncharacterized protein [Palaemon carinicauda]|uniref:uncharacterized protein n=1 Tax=Palaemon carinicauda TaxID=392227 RepID=UPI0035B5DAD4